MKPLAGLLVLAALLAACAGAGEGTVIDVVLDKPTQDRAAVTVEDGRAFINVSSASGIGGLTATLAEGTWPGTVVVRLGLRGLERLEIRYGQFILTTGMSSTSSPNPALMLSVIAEDGTVQSASPSSNIYYPDIRIVGAGETPAFPLPDGSAFEITLPPHFHRDDFASFTIQWIDFYR